MKRKSESIKHSSVSTEKIAYYVKGLSKGKIDTGKIIMVIKSQFGDDDIKEFADKYYECSNDDNVRNIANLLRSVSPKYMDKYLQKYTS